MPSSARIQVVDLSAQIGYEMLVMKLNMLEDECYSPQFMPPSAPVQLADITTRFGYESFVSKLRVLEHEQATAAARTPIRSAGTASDIDIDCAGAQLRARLGVPCMMDLTWPDKAVPIVTVHEIAQATYKRNSLDTESVQNLLSILNSGSGVTPSLSRSTSDFSSGSALSESDFEPPSPASESLSVCLPGCECDLGVWELSAECECALEDGFERAERWVEELVNDD